MSARIRRGVEDLGTHADGESFGVISAIVRVGNLYIASHPRHEDLPNLLFMR